MNKLSIVWQFLCLFILLNQGWIQPREHRNGQTNAMHFSHSRFIFTTYNFSDSTRTKSQLQVYWEFVNDILQFIKQSEHNYTAQYEMSVEILDTQDNYIEGKTIRNSIKVSSFEETNSNKLKNTGSTKFSIRSGDYTLRIELTDLDTQKRMTQIQEIKLNDYSRKNLACSDLIFFDNVVQKVPDDALFPNITSSFSDSLLKPTLYFEIYPLPLTQNLNLTVKIVDSNARLIAEQVENIETSQKIIPKTFDLKSIVSKPGRYAVRVQLSQDKKLANQDSRFYINWNSHEMIFNKIDDTMELLTALGNPEEFKNYKNAPEPEKIDALEAFWKKRDPSPETEENEIKAEFYRRLEFVNQHFTIHFLDKPGWKTDRGQIFIKFGEPSNIEQQASEINRPAYEIWVYDSIHQRIIFVDRTGFGDFQLLKIE